MRVWVKPGVSLRNLQPQTVWAMERVREVYESRGINCVFTSVWRPAQPGVSSLHPAGRAFDTDTDHDISGAIWNLIVDEVASILGDEYDVLAHDAGTGMHLHVEWDPDWMKASPPPVVA